MINRLSVFGFNKLSKLYASLYDLPISKHVIAPYCKFHYEDKDYLNQFKPPNQKLTYNSFQDFFIRQFKELPNPKSRYIWPCEGLLCEIDYVKNIKKTNVKGDITYVHDIFGLTEQNINRNYVFTDVFLHNKNYHRIHAPVSGTISRIQHIKGDLVILRPWIYKQNPSIPAFRNERINIDIIDNEYRMWHLSIVGGPAVGTIKLPETIKLGAKVGRIDELALFYLGSTCCMVSPIKPKYLKKNDLVFMGMDY